MKNLFIETELHRRRQEKLISQLSQIGIYDPLDFFQIAHLIVGTPIPTRQGTYTITKIRSVVYLPKEEENKKGKTTPIYESIIYVKPQNGKTSTYRTFFHDKKPSKPRKAIQAIEDTLLAEWITKPSKTPAMDAIEAGLMKYHKSNS
jgi:hypothetical protein